VLVNNVGGVFHRWFLDSPEKAWDAMLRVNLRSVLHGTHVVGTYARSYLAPDPKARAGLPGNWSWLLLAVGLVMVFSASSVAALFQGEDSLYYFWQQGVVALVGMVALVGLSRFDYQYDGDGQVKSRLIVERVETLDMLRRDAPQLERALQQAGLKTSDNALEFSLRHQAPHRDRDDPLQNGARLIAPDDSAASLDTAQQHYGRRLGLGGGIDIRV